MLRYISQTIREEINEKVIPAAIPNEIAPGMTFSSGLF
jgi:hypothetical protein